MTTEVKNTEASEELTKSIDALIDELFVEESPVSEEVEKSMVKDESPETETADEAMKKVPAAQKDESRNAGRPEQISDIPQKDKDGKREKKYDDAIAEKKSDKDGKTAEQSQTQPPKEMKKSVEISEEEYAEFQTFKKSQEEAAEVEKLEKAKKEQTDLIKSAVAEATQFFKSENEELQKKIEEQGKLLRAMANKPRPAKAITNIAALEKSETAKQATFSKAEVLDIAEDLVKSNRLSMEHVIELENTGYIFDESARSVLESEVKKRG